MKHIHLKRLPNKPIVLYSLDDAKAQAYRWRRYSRDYFKRFIEKPLEAFFDSKLFHEYAHILLTVTIYISTALILAAFYLEMTNK